MSRLQRTDTRNNLTIPSYERGRLLTGENHYSETSPSMNQYSFFLTSSSDYSKFPANLMVSKERARKHKIRDKRKYIRGRLPLLIEKEALLKLFNDFVLLFRFYSSRHFHITDHIFHMRSI